MAVLRARRPERQQQVDQVQHVDAAAGVNGALVAAIVVTVGIGLDH